MPNHSKSSISAAPCFLKLTPLTGYFLFWRLFRRILSQTSPSFWFRKGILPAAQIHPLPNSSPRFHILLVFRIKKKLTILTPRLQPHYQDATFSRPYECLPCHPRHHLGPASCLEGLSEDRPCLLGAVGDVQASGFYIGVPLIDALRAIAIPSSAPLASSLQSLDLRIIAAYVVKIRHPLAPVSLVTFMSFLYMKIYMKSLSTSQSCGLPAG